MGLPLYSARTKFPRDITWEQPPPTGWARFLAWESRDENSDLEDLEDLDELEDLDVPFAEGKGIQGSRPGIMPCTRETMKNDMYNYLETFKISCEATGHETTVHNCVVLKQSQWLKDKFDSRDDPAAPVCVPAHIRWWQLAWALEYMYEGRVPGFHLLAGENMPARFPGRDPRSIAWGLIELWDAAHFFGLQGLKDRAEGAFVSYFCDGIHHAIQVHEGNRDRTTEEVAGSLAGREPRVAHEFKQAAWRIFGDPDVMTTDYFCISMSDDRFGLPDLLAEDTPAILEWESAMFDTPRDPRDQDADSEIEAVYANIMVRRYSDNSDTFKSILIALCMQFANLGLFDLEWFQLFMIYINSSLPYLPYGLRDALFERMEESPDQWPKDKYPDAPFSFVGGDWRLTASNARTVPSLTSHSGEEPSPSMPENVEQEEPAAEQQ